MVQVTCHGVLHSYIDYKCFTCSVEDSQWGSGTQVHVGTNQSVVI